MADEHAKFPVASWAVVGRRTVKFPTETIVEERGKRLVENERPYRGGAKLDDTNWKARRWTVTVTFENSIQEDGLDDVALYPTILNELIASFDELETGDLTLPTRGIRRARALSYRRTESPELKDGATCEFLFVEDNEESIVADALAAPSVNATVRRLAEQTKFSADAIGVFDTNSADLVEFASEVEALLLAPGRAADDLNASVRRNRRAIERITDAQRQLSRDVGGGFDSPEGGLTEVGLRRLSDRQASAVGERSRDLPATRDYVVASDTDLYAIAASLGQDAGTLLDLNSARIEDPLDLRVGDVIRVFVSGAAVGA